MIKVMIADDQELIRESLQVVLNMNADMKVTGTAKDGHELLKLIKTDAPDVVLLDVRMPRLDGVAATKEIKNLYPKTKIIILTTFDDDEYVYNALKYGASGYLLKGVSVPDLSKAIRTVASGGSILNPFVMTKVVKLFNQMAKTNITAPIDESGANHLSRTEKNVARLVGRGLSNKEIADALSLTSGTVRNNLSSALSKLNLRDRTQLAIWAVHTGLYTEDLS